MSQLPLPDAYQRAILNPKLCFADTELKGGMIHANRHGLPIPWSGQFATVFRIQTPGGARAVRCFTSRVSDHQERYARLHQHTNGKALSMLAAFEYQPNGIRVNGVWYPIVKMEWVNGVRLDDYIEELALKRDTKRLHDLAIQWSKLVRCLKQNQIAHGDLQHENILVSQGDFRLVDYDGVFVPGLAGRAGLEIGHVHYQHPRRTPADFNLEIDNFSALVIYLSLKALAVDPGLWKKFHKDKHLILRSDDFKSPQSSPVIAALKQSRNAEVKALAAVLATACAAPMAAAPALDSLSATQVTPQSVQLPSRKKTRSTGGTQSKERVWTSRWYLRSWQAWVVLGMGSITALVIQAPWVITLGIIGYLLVLLAESRNCGAGNFQKLESLNAALEARNQQLSQEVQTLKVEIGKLQKQIK